MKHASLCLAASAAAMAFVSTASFAAELIQNGGFEDGVKTVTIGSFTNFEVPVDWDPNAAFVQFSGFNHVTSSVFHSGANSLSIGDFDDEDLAELSQGFSDQAGATYTVTFWGFDGGAGGDSNAFLRVSVGGSSDTFEDGIATWTEGGFSFVGTGFDTLVIAAQTNPSEWFVDDVSVTGAAGSVPESSTWAMLLLGFAGLGFAGYRGSGKSSALAA